jgi:hypothetical protein
VTYAEPPPELIFRRAAEVDAPDLETFSCSRGAIHEAEVEQFIRRQALTRALAVDTQYRLYVTLEGDRIVAVAGHHPELLLVATDDTAHTFRATGLTRLHVLALSLRDQGNVCSDGRRISDLVMDSLIREALVSNETGMLTAVVAKENLRSLTLLERHGLKSQVEYDALHLRLSARFRRPGG